MTVTDATVGRAFQAWLDHHNARELTERSPQGAMRAALEAVWPEMPTGAVVRCEYEFDGYVVTRCEAPHRFVVSRADGDQSYSGGDEPGVQYACPAHLADALFGMADGDDVIAKLHDQVYLCNHRPYGDSPAWRPSDSFWRLVPCGHPSEPVAWVGPEGPVCHCGRELDAGISTSFVRGFYEIGTEWPLVICEECGCTVAIPQEAQW